MAELATIARPYAEALFKAVAASDAPALSAQMNTLALVAADDRLRGFADNPKTQAAQVFDVIGAAVGGALDAKIANLLHAIIDNGRLAALPEMAAQFQTLVNARSGVSEATIQSAFAIDDAQLAQVIATLEKRFGRKLNAKVEVDPELIGGIRAIVGDEVLDTSVKARLEQMKVALTA
ncbi:MAG: F0F1 ATP synthase subunit delta [Burkholderiaceae bacterium]|nr:F0F1 ATP synthase subunit delta [Burkholderiaceae bacterium]